MDCGLSLLQPSTEQRRFTRCCGAVSFATQVSVALAVLFSVKEIHNSKTIHSLPLKKAIRIALQQVSLVKVATCSSFLRFPTHSRQLKHASIHTAITEVSVQISSHAQHSGATRKIISHVLLLLRPMLPSETVLNSNMLIIERSAEEAAKGNAAPLSSFRHPCAAEEGHGATDAVAISAGLHCGP